MKCTGYNDVPHTFDKPIFQSIIMFFSMSLVIFVDLIMDFFRRRSASSNYAQLDESQDGEKEKQAPKEKQASVFVILIPCTFDLIASTLMTFGLIWTPASVFQMLRGAMIIFSSILSRIFFGKKVRWGQLIGIIISVVALCLVGVAAVKTPSSGLTQVTGFQTAIGIGLILVAQLIQAGQIVAEEFFMKNLTLPPLKIVAFEGIFGLIMTLLIACPFGYFMPGSDYSPMAHNSLENTYDSFVCMFNSWGIMGIMVIFAVAVLGLNAYGMLVTNVFNAVNRTIFESVRTACVWLVMIIIEFCWEDHGEKLTYWSILELAGFVILFVATLIYNRVFEFPYIKRLDAKTDEEEKEKVKEK